MNENSKQHSVLPRITVGIILIIIFMVGYLVLRKTGAISVIMDAERLREFVLRFGSICPFIIIGVMAVAIVINPIPSAPIALAAGMIYGHTLGTLLIVTGAFIGAMIAFVIGRLVGHEILYRWFGDKLQVGLLGSQNALMGIVFFSRLIPFISFDIISYAAGLTEIKIWRFALATLTGIIPISFMLAHFGSEMGSADMKRITTTVFWLGFLTLIPILINVIRRHRSKMAGKRSLS